jgi:hypothetical protein
MPSFAYILYMTSEIIFTLIPLFLIALLVGIWFGPYDFTFDDEDYQG